MRYLTLGEILELHRRIIKASGGAEGIRDLGALESAVAQPKATFDAMDLYPSLADKAAALCFSIVQNHAFLDGNKRTGHAAMSCRHVCRRGPQSQLATGHPAARILP